jgi:PIN domain nuclease of toxin-antitoxin system
MRLLLDTHAFLWFILDEPQLSSTARSLIADPNNQIDVSPATYWEIAIKIRLDKYKLPEPFQEFMERQIAANRFNILHRASSCCSINNISISSQRPLRPFIGRAGGG